MKYYEFSPQLEPSSNPVLLNNIIAYNSVADRSSSMLHIKHITFTSTCFDHSWDFVGRHYVATRQIRCLTLGGTFKCHNLFQHLLLITDMSVSLLSCINTYDVLTE